MFAFRAWTISPPGILRSINHNHIWTRAGNVASCINSDYYKDSPWGDVDKINHCEVAPQKECKCGFYAFLAAEWVVARFSSIERPCFGLVWAEGGQEGKGIILHGDGALRAHKMSILALAAPLYLYSNRAFEKPIIQSFEAIARSLGVSYILAQSRPDLIDWLKAHKQYVASEFGYEENE